uniref:Uncharacterized protein n=1 Tax=Panagrolaimus davidi TaxID=227884 RepID=A0A914PKJ0_9BILA
MSVRKFDNDDTNVKEEMSEPNVLQMNNLNESYNAGVGPQIVNHREEREGNQESVDRAAEEVDDIKEIPEIKTEVKAEPEIFILDDVVETNEVQPEIKQESVAESHHFGVPSGDFLRSTLGKFDIEPTNEVDAFYSEFQYTKIPTTASPGATFEISSSTDSFFKCLSLYLTGKEEHFSNIKMGIRVYFYDNSKTFGMLFYLIFL